MGLSARQKALALLAVGSGWTRSIYLIMIRSSQSRLRNDKPRSVRAFLTSFKLVTPKFLQPKSSASVRLVSSLIVRILSFCRHFRERTDNWRSSTGLCPSPSSWLMAPMSSMGYPVITASTTIIAVTPSITPVIDIKALIEINACFCLARRYRRLTKNSNDMIFAC